MKTLLLAIKTVALMLINFIKRTTKYPHTFFKKATRDELNKNHKPKNSTPRTKPKKRNGTYRPRHRNEETHIPREVTQKLVKLILLTATPLLTTTVALASAVALALAIAPIAAVSLASATVLAAARVLDPAAHTHQGPGIDPRITTNQHLVHLEPNQRGETASKELDTGKNMHSRHGSCPKN